MVLPPGIESLLWEYDPKDLRAVEELPDVVLGRIMARGGWDEMRWLLANCDRQRMRDFLETRGRRLLPPREMAFWGFACSLPERRTSELVEESRHRQQTWRG